MRLYQLAAYCKSTGTFAVINGDTMTANLYWYDGFETHFFQEVSLR